MEDVHYTLWLGAEADVWDGMGRYWTGWWLAGWQYWCD